MSWFKLKRPMDENSNVDYGDIVNAKQALRQLGYYQPPFGNEIGAWVDPPLFDGIRKFQKDNRLKVDGLMKPGGPTERAINQRLDRGNSPRSQKFNFDEMLPNPCTCREWDDNPYLM